MTLKLRRHCSLAPAMLAGALILPGLAPAAAPLAAVPADCMLAVAGEPIQNLFNPANRATPAADIQPGLPLSAILAFLNAAGLVPDEGQVFTDVAAALPLLGRYRYAITLLDISGRHVLSSSPANRPSIRLEQLQAAVVLDTGGRHADIIELLNHVLGRYTNNEMARLTTRSTGSVPHQRLADQRLPGWAVWEWGSFDNLFVVSFGDGAFERIAAAHQRRSPRLVDDTWFRRAEGSLTGPNPVFTFTAAYQRLQDRLAEVGGHRPAAVLAALGAEGITRDHWSVALDSRELLLHRFYRRANHDLHRTYAGDAQLSARHRPCIPPTARFYAVLNVSARWLVDSVPQAVLAGSSVRKAQAYRQYWAQIERELGMDIDGQIVANLEDAVILCDYPSHPLGIPVALTAAVPIRNAAEVRNAVDAAFSAWARRLDSKEGSALFELSVRRTDDGVWYVQAGLLGPALKVIDRYLVISWSPQALREALPFFERSDAPAAPN